MKKNQSVLRTSKKDKLVENEIIEENPHFNSILEDPLFIQVSSELQQGKWQSCQDLINALTKKYPDDPNLAEFKSEFQFQYSIVKNIEKSASEKKRSAQKQNFKELLILLGAALIVILLVGAVFFFYTSSTSHTRQAQQNSQLAAYAEQVDSLLNSGQPEKAVIVVKLMQNIDAANPTVVALSAKTDEMLKLQQEYDSAVAEITAGNYSSALSLLQSIEQESPNYRDVPHLTDKVQTIIKVNQATLDGRAAYENNDWQTTIDSFEFVQANDVNSFTGDMKTMLLNGYLQRIIQMLGSKTTTYEQIDQAEMYYRRATAMIPQSKTFVDQRADLEKISSDLLILSFTQSAYQITQDPDQNLALVNQALSYVKKAANLDPTNASITSELNKLTLYQAGYQYFLGMNWSQAIDQLRTLFTMDANYANGYARQMLYESYFARGEQLVQAGYLADARKQFELAEMLTWNEPNLVNFYQVEIKLAQTLEQMGDFQDAASYYKYAIDMVKFSQRAAAHSEFVANLISAEDLYANGQFQQSVELFKSTLKDQDYFFTSTEVTVHKGSTLALVAARYLSSVSLIVEKNGLPDQPTLSENRTLIILTIPE